MAGCGIKATTRSLSLSLPPFVLPKLSSSVLFRRRVSSTRSACVHACVRAWIACRKTSRFFHPPHKRAGVRERELSPNEVSGDMGVVRVTTGAKNRENRLAALL